MAATKISFIFLEIFKFLDGILILIQVLNRGFGPEEHKKDNCGTLWVK
jgi:hypothetical protein